MKVRGNLPAGLVEDKEGLFTIKAILKYKARNLLLGNKSIFDTLKQKCKKKKKK